MRQQVIEQSHGQLCYPVDPTSRAEAAVGGTVVCNASGFVPGEYGATRAWVDAVDLVLPDGGVVRARRGEYVSEAGMLVLVGEGSTTEWPVPTYPRPRVKNASGPFSAPDGRMDFVDLVVGSEGIFGLLTACTLRLRSRPQMHLDLLFRQL